jgi:hypothetical protein
MGRRTFLGGLFLGLIGIALGVAGSLAWRHLQPGPPAADGLPPRSLEATVYLPLHDNRGKPFPPARLRGAIDLLVRRFGGATLGPRRQGFWLAADKRVQAEPVQLLTVSFARDRLEEFRRAVARVGRRLGQEAIYVRFEEPRVELIDAAAESREKER